MRDAGGVMPKLNNLIFTNGLEANECPWPIVEDEYLETGTRVLAVLEIGERVVRVFGAGEFLGIALVPVMYKGSRGIAHLPCIRTDRGEYIYGSECQLVPESKQAEYEADGYHLEVVDINTFRAERTAMQLLSALPDEAFQKV